MGRWRISLATGWKLSAPVAAHTDLRLALQLLVGESAIPIQIPCNYLRWVCPLEFGVKFGSTEPAVMHNSSIFYRPSRAHHPCSRLREKLFWHARTSMVRTCGATGKHSHRIAEQDRRDSGPSWINAGCVTSPFIWGTSFGSSRLSGDPLLLWWLVRHTRRASWPVHVVRVVWRKITSSISWRVQKVCG